MFTTMEKRMFTTIETKDVYNHGKKGCIQQWKQRMYTTMETKDVYNHVNK